MAFKEDKCDYNRLCNIKISGVTGEGLQQLLNRVTEVLKTLPKEELVEIEERVVYTLEDDKDEFVVRKEGDMFIIELEKVKELEEYLRNNEEGMLRYQYKLGYKEEQLEDIKEEFPSLGSEESHMYCVCRARMKKNRTSWSVEGAEAMLKVIMNKMNGTLEEIITRKAEDFQKK